MINIILVVIIVVSYLIGSFPTALFVNKVLNKTDPRDVGSKNLGALNTFRITEKKKNKVIAVFAFLFVFLVDAGKGVFCVWLAQELIVGPELIGICLASFFAVLGHNYSILLKFHGGRGAATLMGIIIYLNFPLFFVWIGSVFFFMVLFELIVPNKTKGSFLKRVISDQIMGRLFGEVFALLPFYFLSVVTFWPVLLTTPLVLIKHIDRIKKQLQDYNNE